MKSLVYLSVCSCKNKLFELVRNPFKLILTVGFVLLTVLNLFVDNFGYSGGRPIEEFFAIIFIFYICSFVIQASKGFSHGGTMFSLADVNFLFMSPVKPSSVLFHGMLGQLGSSLWMGLIFIYQFALLRSFYPVSVKQMLLCVIGYGGVIFLSQLMGMLIYFFTCGEEVKVKKAKTAFLAVMAVFVLVFLFNFDLSLPSVASAVSAVNSDYMKLFPVAGWLFDFVEGVFEGKTAMSLCGLVLCAIFVVSVFVALSKAKHGYYEDVLVTAEKNALSKEKGKAVTDIKVSEKSRNILLKGQGTSVIFFKHLLENRRSKSFLLSTSSLFYLVLVGVYAFVFKNGMVPLFMMSCMSCVLTVLSGRWVKELTMPYIYILPGSPVRKLFFMLPEMLPKVITESILHCVLIGVACKLGMKTVFALFCARIAFSFVLMSSALITARIYREKEKNNIFAFICILLGFVFALPSIGVAMFVTFYGFGLINAFLIMSAVNVAVGFVLLIFARKLLNFAD